MANVLVFLEHKDGKIRRSSIELLGVAKASGSTVWACAVGDGAANLASEAGSFGVAKLFACSKSDFNNYNPELFSGLLAKVISANKPEVVLASASLLGKDLFPRVAAKTGNGVATDCTTLTISGSDVKARRPMYAGKLSAEVSFANSSTKILTLRPNSFEAPKAAGGAAAQVEEVPFEMPSLKTLVKEVVKGTTNKLDLTEANIIVTAGRGIKGPENLKIVEDLAAALGATVGASRAVVDAGWAPHDMQVGQTGKTVSPTLYIAVGISGAIQHLAGMSSSKVIVAINKDKDAPIFQKATYGLVGDLFEILPILTEEFKHALKE